MSGNPVPKSGYRSADREALLSAPSLHGEACACCGRPATNAHHVCIKGMGGAAVEGPTVPLCGMGNTGGCHSLAHLNGGRLTFRYDDKRGMWWFVVDDEAARAITKRGRRIKGGEHPCYGEVSTDTPKASESDTLHVQNDSTPLADEPCTADGVTSPCGDTAPDVGDATPPASYEAAPCDLAAIDADLDEIDRLEAMLAWKRGERLNEARAWFIANRAGKREASVDYKAWYIDSRHYSACNVSRHRDFASLPVEAADIGISRGVYVARARDDGKVSEAEGIALARTLSVSDLKETFWPSPECTPECKVVCPLDGRDCKKKPKGEPE